MTQFRDDNTNGYDAAELAELNAAWTRIASHGAPLDSDDIAVRSMLDNWSETLLAEYAAGKRGADLTAWFYE
jgi:hypothetical protein